ncbi:mismatch repair ATPase MSH1 NDAI_0B04370 [Naumovozyma dairenensis CBS 421]|uniref:DNA mismatch repair proteins mutS family domain-containing protein n=1 Tax=Naumovozyma dairenensis (strain ATCC 10597 / BCRC 20456 / CBS 421 / NBRC 0211 / NRRL Y-12639) TaxID=1071378 RepID=G0W6R0_NAUDC|nr:hypothetical protein NDAI_0B04370 [Naumovozyma dairenensis CBS 421]CCD23471.1 hypothetical protein NDAI_0B04370 [Naumovozyma dairenensis CBS 421]
MSCVKWYRQLCTRVYVRYNHSEQRIIRKPQITKLPISFNNPPRPISTDTSSGLAEIDKPKSLEKTSDDHSANGTIQNLSPTLRYVRKLMDEHKDNVVLTQIGSFYELYFEQATKYAPKLNISLTSKTLSQGKIPFAGFPVPQLGRHLKVLVNDYGYSVTIADQFPKNEIADNEQYKFVRRVTRIVTPGTFIDDAFENFQENTYLLNVEFPGNCMKHIADPSLKIGLSWCDISTGEIFVQQVLLRDLVSSITRIKPKEILLNDDLIPFNILSGQWYPELVELKKYFVKYQKLPAQHRTIETFSNLFTSGTTKLARKQLMIQLQTFTQKEIVALRNLLIYISDHLPHFSTNLQVPQRQLTTSIMQIDSRTSTALELHSTVRNNSRKGTLLSSIRRTATPSGTRLLTQWLSGPSLALTEITNRQKLVSFFKDNPDISGNVLTMLKKTYDLTRILQKFSFGRGEALELIQLAQSLQMCNGISDYILSNLSSLQLKKTVRDLLQGLANSLLFDKEYLANVLENLNEEELINLQTQEEREGDPYLNNEASTGTNSSFPLSVNVVKPSFSKKLQNLHDDYKKLLSEKTSLEKTYNDVFVSLGARHVLLKKKQNNDFALHITGSPSNLKKVNEYINSCSKINDSTFVSLQQSNQTRWVSHKSWTDLGYKLDLGELKIKKEESFIMDTFKNRFIENSDIIRKVSYSLGYLDVMLSFASLAKEKNLVCPKLDNSTKLEIIGGRHLMVEEGLSLNSLNKFVLNDCILSGGELWVVTGPNMGGKSTFLRQNAIIVILAQIGCFVPCARAHIGLVDKIFSRVGSADDLYNEMSTFMVEMVETSFILRGATEKSLAILDEIGRGTSGKEGVSIAYATAKYLIWNNSCRSLFATHFGTELKKIIDEQKDKAISDSVSFYRSGIIELGKGEFIYDHKLRSGICQKSDAIKVARTAGFPEEALEEAIKLLQ